MELRRGGVSAAVHPAVLPSARPTRMKRPPRCADTPRGALRSLLVVTSLAPLAARPLDVAPGLRGSRVRIGLEPAEGGGRRGPGRGGCPPRAGGRSPANTSRWVTTLSVLTRVAQDSSISPSWAEKFHRDRRFGAKERKRADFCPQANWHPPCSDGGSVGSALISMGVPTRESTARSTVSPGLGPAARPRIAGVRPAATHWRAARLADRSTMGRQDPAGRRHGAVPDAVARRCGRHRAAAATRDVARVVRTAARRRPPPAVGVVSGSRLPAFPR